MTFYEYILNCFKVMFVCLCWSFTAQSTMRSCRAGQLIVVLFLGRLSRLRPSKQLTNTKDVLGSKWQVPLGFNSRNNNISVKFSRLPKDRSSKGHNSKESIQELGCLCSAFRLMLVNICMTLTFHEDILNGYKVTEQTQFCLRNCYL